MWGYTPVQITGVLVLFSTNFIIALFKTTVQLIFYDLDTKTLSNVIHHVQRSVVVCTALLQ